jgi:quercetin dioxygenase-like cupin family protein
MAVFASVLSAPLRERNHMPVMIRLASVMMVSAMFGMGTGGDARATEVREGAFIVVPAGAGLDIFPGKWKITGNQSKGAFALVEVYDRSTRETPPHTHMREDEGWYVIEGELEFAVGGRKAIAGPGTFVYAARNVPHMFRVTKVPAKYLILFAPAGLEAFFVEAAQLRKQYADGAPELRKKLNELRAKYGLLPGDPVPK